MNLRDILVNNSIKKADETHSSKRKNLQFVVDSPNEYEDSNEQHKVVSLSILDVVYDNKVCHLVYMRDVTSFIKKPLCSMNSEADKTSEIEEVTRSLISTPNKCISNLSARLANVKTKESNKLRLQNLIMTLRK